MNSLIKVLLLLAIASPAYSIVITCRFETAGWVVIGFQYACYVVRIQDPETAEVTQVIGNHTSGRTNDDVIIFNSVQKEFSIFPKGLEKFFPNLQAIQIYECDLTSISSADLAPWPGLEVFYVGYNKIESLDGNLFENSPKLQWIHFSDNSIQNVGLNLLSSLNMLTYANFQNNPCINTLAPNRLQIENLKAQLITQCPPLATTEESQTTITISSTTVDSGQCLARCSLNEETDELREESALLRRDLDHQKALVEELQTIVRELASSSCLCRL